MKSAKISLLLFLLITLISFKNSFWQSKFIKLTPDGKINYVPDDKGNTIPDFSRVGYHNGDKDIPDLPVVKTVSPSQGDAAEKTIQQAIDELSKKDPDKNGFRGAILLKKGTYTIRGTIRINAGGIVLRGEGDGPDGTRLIAAGKDKRHLISVSGQGSRKETAGTRKKITTPYVPVGAMSFTIESASGLKPGDNIVVLRPGTKNWISDIKMDRIIEREDTKQWQAKEYDLHFERQVTKTEGNKVYIDNPIVMAMEPDYGGGFIYKYTFDGRIAESGIENMRFESEFANETDEDHSWTAIEINKAENCWIKNVSSYYFSFACVSVKNDAKLITVRDSKCFDAKSQITGGRRYSFNNEGQLNLFMNLETTEGRHDYVTGARVLGPNVFYNCRSSYTHADIGPHHRWAVGTLFDNIVTDGEINVQDRGKMGTGHGWSGANQVVWNCTAKSAAIQNPWVSAKNYCIGLQGKKAPGTFSDRPDGIWEGQNQPGLTPKSLYQAQLASRKQFTK